MTDNLKVPCEVYSRIVGYLRPVQDWNPGKKQEFEDRVTFDMSKKISEERMIRFSPREEEPLSSKIEEEEKDETV